MALHIARLDERFDLVQQHVHFVGKVTPIVRRQRPVIEQPRHDGTQSGKVTCVDMVDSHLQSVFLAAIQISSADGEVRSYLVLMDEQPLIAVSSAPAMVMVRITAVLMRTSRQAP